MRRIDRKRIFRQLSAAAFGVFGLAGNRWAAAISIRADTLQSSYTALSAESQYAPTGFVDVIDVPYTGGYEDLFGSGELIAPDWILTAAHVVTENETGPAFSPSNVSFGMGASTTAFMTAPDAISKVIADPAFNGDADEGQDLALLQLATPITNVTPAQIYTSSLGSEIGLTATVVGYGLTGNGNSGDTNGSPGTRQAMQDIIYAFGGQTVTGGTPTHPTHTSLSGISSNILFTQFESPVTNQQQNTNTMGGTSATPLTLAGATTPGDSGGGVYVTVNNQTYLIALVDFGENLRMSPIGEYGDFDGYTRLDVANSVDFLDSNLIATSNWSNTGGGTWDSLSNWSNSEIPEIAQSTANFGSAIQIASTVTLDANWTVGTVTFNNINSYTLAAGSGGTITLDNGGASATAALTDNGGTHTISAPVNLNSGLLATVVNPGDALFITGPISGAGSITLTGAGTLSLAGVNTYAGATNITSGTLQVATATALPATTAVTVGTASTTATLQLTAPNGTFAVSTVASLKINTGSTVDLVTNALAINFGSPANDPIAAVVSALTNGYSSGFWTGTGITSSAAAADSSLYTVGYADGNVDTNGAAAPNQILVKFTLAGDANLDGTVNFADLLVVAQHFNTSGNDWAEGNFLYDPNGVVGFSDLLLVAQNFNLSLSELVPQVLTETFASPEALSAQIQPIPEPRAILLIAAGAAGLLGRRRRLPLPAGR
jgi:autotransporter-associated beta strand protein